MRPRAAFLVLLAAAAVSLVASFVLSVDAWRIAGDTSVRLSCDINEVISCGKVAQSWQATVLGFPNAFVGIATQAILLGLTAVALLGGVLPRPVLRGMWLLTAGEVVFAGWLFAQSYLDIRALCPWCLSVTASTLAGFAATSRICLRESALPLPARVRAVLMRGLDWDVDAIVVVTGWVALAALVLYRYA